MIKQKQKQRTSIVVHITKILFQILSHTAYFSSLKQQVEIRLSLQAMYLINLPKHQGKEIYSSFGRNYTSHHPLQTSLYSGGSPQSSANSSLSGWCMGTLHQMEQSSIQIFYHLLPCLPFKQISVKDSCQN